MFPGLTTKLSESSVASAATITVKSDLVRLTGNTQVSTILQPNGGFSGIVHIVPVDGGVQFTTGGNIAKAALSVQNQVLTLVYSKATGLWYPGPIS